VLQDILNNITILKFNILSKDVYDSITLQYLELTALLNIGQCEAGYTHTHSDIVRTTSVRYMSHQAVKYKV
jgi:hypothetical protein